MAQSTDKIAAQVRTETGSRACGRLRRSGNVPCVVYTNGNEATLLKADSQTIEKAIASPHILALDIDNKEEKNVLLQEAQWDYLTNTLVHVDFKEIRMDEKLQTEVPLIAVGEPVGLSQGGLLDQQLFEVTVECFPADLPEKIEVDVSALEMGDHFQIGDLQAPENVEIIYADETQSLFHIAKPMREEDLESATAEGEEGLEGEEGVEGGEGAAAGEAEAANESAE